MRALKLDPKRTFDAVIERHAPSRAIAETILDNRLYRNLSDALAGIGDYMAMEKLLELYEDPSTDLIVLDTPPAREALDFLGAPERLLDLLNSRATTLLGGGLKFSDMAARAVLSAFDRVTGLRLLGDVQAFVRSFEGHVSGFRRARRPRQVDPLQPRLHRDSDHHRRRVANRRDRRFRPRRWKPPAFQSTPW